MNSQWRCNEKPSDLEGVDPTLHIEPDELHPRVYTLRHDDGDHVVDPEQRDQHQGGAGQLPAKQTQVRYIPRYVQKNQNAR